MWLTCSIRSLIRFACNVFLVLPALAGGIGALDRPAGAQQQDEMLAGELAPLLAAADARAFDAALFREALGHPDVAVRRQAALAAGRIGDPAALDLLVAALSDSAPAVRAAAAFGLGLLKDARAVEPLLALVRSVPAAEQGTAQLEAVTAIAKIGGDEGAAALRGILGNATTPGVPTSLAQRTALLEAWRLGGGKGGGARAPVPALIGYAEDPDVTARWHALYSLARLRVARGVTVLLNALQDPTPLVRAVAARGVSRALTDSVNLDPVDVAARLRPLLSDRDPGVRINGLRALATFRDSAVSGLAAPLVSDADLNVAVQAETTLGVLGGTRALEALRGRLTSAVFALRRQAVIALAQADSAAGVAVAATLTSDADWRWRSVAAEAFGAAAHCAGARHHPGRAGARAARPRRSRGAERCRRPARAHARARRRGPPGASLPPRRW
jgi:HEAT repeat protein